MTNFINLTLGFWIGIPSILSIFFIRELFTRTNESTGITTYAPLGFAIIPIYCIILAMGWGLFLLPKMYSNLKVGMKKYTTVMAITFLYAGFSPLIGMQGGMIVLMTIILIFLTATEGLNKTPTNSKNDHPRTNPS